jgi:hypothetical protein
MKTYQKDLLAKLTEDGWELILQEDYTDWWSNGYWKIKSVKNNWGLEIYIHFLVDPHYDGPKKETAVWAVAASSVLPADRLEAENGISLMALSKGKFNENLSEFVREINNYRNRV